MPVYSLAELPIYGGSMNTVSPSPALAYDLDEMMSHGGELWEKLRGARIFVTGGTGFFGRWLLESFVHINRAKNLGASMVVLSRDPAAFEAVAPHLLAGGEVTLMQGDVRYFTPPAGPFTHIIHAATESSGAQKLHSRIHMMDTILIGTRRMLDFAREMGNPRMLYVSTGAVYGGMRASALPIAEKDAIGPLTMDVNIEYAESKRMAEALCGIYHREFGLPVTIARGFAFVGPHLPLDEHFAIGNFIRDALAGKPIHVNGDGTAVRSYLYASDLARWLWTVLLTGTPAHPYNVGSDEAVSIAQLAEQVRQVVNPNVKVEIAAKSVADAPLNAQVPEITRAASELGLRPVVGLEEAVRRTAEWNRAQHANMAAKPQKSIPILAKPDAVVFDFDGVMTDNRVAVLQDGREAVFCNRSDGLGISMVKKLGIPLLVLSTEKNPVVAARCKKLGLECIQGSDAKEVALAAWLAEHNYSPARTVYLGNDINDLGCLKMVGFPVVVNDAYEDVKRVATLVLTRRGGNGAVRELCDRICAAQQV